MPQSNLLLALAAASDYHTAFASALLRSIRLTHPDGFILGDVYFGERPRRAYGQGVRQCPTSAMQESSWPQSVSGQRFCASSNSVST